MNFSVKHVTFVSTIHLQMWFDASGRAYVSLATRYDPVRKYWLKFKQNACLVIVYSGTITLVVQGLLLLLLLDFLT